LGVLKIIATRNYILCRLRDSFESRIEKKQYVLSTCARPFRLQVRNKGQQLEREDPPPYSLLYNTT